MPVKAVLHKWMGRLIALLGLAQIPLGLTLYGSPLFLFILYALVVFTLFIAYFVLSYINEKNEGRDHDSDTSWVSGSGSTVSKRRQSRLGTFAKTAAAAGGMGYITHKLRNRNEAVPSRRNSGSFVEEEKYSEHGHEPRHEGGFGKKVLGAGLLGGLAYKIFGGRKKNDDGSVTSYNYTASNDSRRQEEGMSPNAHHPLNRPPSHHRSHSSASYTNSDYTSASPSRQDRRGHGLRNTVAGIGALGVARKLFKNRREKKEQRRIDELRQQDIEEERINRANSRRQKFTGDDYGRPGAASVTSTNLTPAPPGGPVGSGAIPYPPSIPGIPGNQSAISANRPPTIDGQPLPVVPPPPQAPPHSVQQMSQSDVFSSPGNNAAAAGLVGGAAGLGAGAAGHRRDRSSSRRRHSGSTGQMASPPVSVKLNMHNDGRHVTLRRLTEEEAAAERARRAQHNSSRHRRHAGTGIGSASEISGMGSDVGHGTDRWRRTEDRERQEQLNMERQHLQNQQAHLNAGNLSVPVPPPPAIPGGEVHGVGSVGSPGTVPSEASETYKMNRKRRRAERAAARAGRSAGGEFD